MVTRTFLNTFVARMFVFLHMLTADVMAGPSALRGPLSQRMARQSKAMSFFEYAILAAIIVALAVIFRGLLENLIRAMWTQITSVWSNNTGN